jgi:hypothetical protein
MPDAAKLLAVSPLADNLTNLSLANNVVGGAGARALAASPRLARLVTLSLFDNGIDEAGARALAESPHLAGLRRLDLRRNVLPKPCLDALRQRFGPGVCLFGN